MTSASICGSWSSLKLMISDRNWETWCQKEFFAKMKAKGKVESETGEARKRKVSLFNSQNCHDCTVCLRQDDAYHHTTKRIFPTSFLDEALSNRSASKQQQMRKRLQV